MREIPRAELLRKLKDLNPHWRQGSIDSDLLEKPRRRYFDLFFPLVSDTSINRAVILMGPRRVGKTVMIFQSIQALIEAGHDQKSLVYISIDTPIFQGIPLEEFLRMHREIHGINKDSQQFFFFDEIQYLPDWERHLKTLVDQQRRIRFVASGSAAAALKLKSTESGAGRFTDFILPPLTFYEFLAIQGKTRSDLDKSSTDYPNVSSIENLNSELVDYINFGGYPEAVFDQSIRANPERFIRGDIIDKVLLRDLPSLYGVSDPQELSRLFSYLAYQTGQEITLDELSTNSGIQKYKIKKELEYLIAAFLLRTVNRVSETGKSFKRIDYYKVYLTNPSLFTALFGLIDQNSDAMGSLIETALFCQFLHDENTMRYLHYAHWRGRTEGEVDFVGMNNRFKAEFCIEAKWSDRFIEKPYELKSLIHFCKKTGVNRAIVTSKSSTADITYDGVRLQFFPSSLVIFMIGQGMLENRELEIKTLLEHLSANQLELGL